MSKSKYYDSTRLFSHNSLTNFVMSPRGNGKTYDGKKRMIKNFIEKGEQGVYIRRTDTELKACKNEFFNDISDIFPEHEFKVEGYMGLIDGEVAIYFVALSTSNNMRSRALPKVTLIMYDEYIVPRGKRYLPNEMYTFLELIFTIGRLRSNYKVYICANAISYVNPFFSYYNILPDSDKRFQKFKNNTVCLELFTSEIYQEEFMETPFGKMIEGTPYCAYSVGNEVYEDTDDFIIPKGRSRIPGKFIFVASFKTEGTEIGVWTNETRTFYFCDKTIDKSSKNRFFIKNYDSEEGLISVEKNKTKNEKIIAVKISFIQSKLWYENQEIKRFMQEKIKPNL